MRHNKNSIKLRKHSSADQTQRQPKVAVNKGFLPRWLLISLCVLVAGGGTWALFEFVIWSNMPPELVGKWVVTNGPDEGGTIDFYRNGTMVAKVNVRGKMGIIDAKVQVEGKKLIATVKNNQTGEEGSRTQTIRVLEKHRLVLEDERGNVINLERAD